MSRDKERNAEKVYDELYNIVNDRLISSQNIEGISVSKNVFFQTVFADPTVVDISELVEYQDKRDFLDIAYLRLLNRMPDISSLIHWENKKVKTIEKYQYIVLKNILSSPEFLYNKVTVINNPWKTRMAFQVGIRRFLLFICFCLPENWQNKIKEFYKKLKK